jgi:hypothetical protein
MSSNHYALKQWSCLLDNLVTEKNLPSYHKKRENSKIGNVDVQKLIEQEIYVPSYRKIYPLNLLQNDVRGRNNSKE